MDFEYELVVRWISASTIDEVENFLTLNSFDFRPFTMGAYFTAFTKFNATDEQLTLLKLVWGDDIKIRPI